MALTAVQQRLILNATLNLDAASQKKIENAFGEGLVKKLMEAAENGGEEFAAGAEAVFDRVHRAQDRLNAELKAAADQLELASQQQQAAIENEALVVAARKKVADATAAGDDAAKDAADTELRAAELAKVTAEKNRDTAEAAAKAAAVSNRDKIKAARAELAMQVRAAKNFEAMYDAANAVRDEQLNREEEIAKFAGERKGRSTGANITQDIKKAMENIQGVVESPSLENALGLLQDATVGGLKRIEIATKDSNNKVVKAIGHLAMKTRGTMEGWSEMVPGGLFDIIKSLVKVFIKLYDASKNMARGFTEGVPALEYQGTEAGFRQTIDIAEDLELTYGEAAQLIGEAWTENVTDGIKEAIVKAKSLGLSVSEVLSQSKKLMSNFGDTADIFGETAGFAAATGMSLQAAYGVLQSVTTGVQLMNTNLKKSFGYVKNLVKTFGEELGQQLAQSLGIVRGMSPQDALKELLLMTPAARSQVFALAKADINTSTKQGSAAAAMLARAEKGGLMEQAVALRHIGPRAELYMEGARGGALFGPAAPNQMSALALMGKATLGMTSADTEVRQLALDFGGMGAGVQAFNNSVGMAAGKIKEMAKSIRTFDDSVNRFVDRAAALVGLGESMNYTDIASVIKGSIDDIVGGGRPEDSIPVKDFIYRGNGTTGSITAISTRDQFFGAMPGGPIDTAMKAVGIANGVRGGAVGGPSRASAGPTNVVVNINGGDLGKVYEVVRNVLQQSGLRPPAGAYAG